MTERTKFALGFLALAIAIAVWTLVVCRLQKHPEFWLAVGIEMPKVKKKKPRVEIPRLAEMRTSLAVVPVPRQYALTWTYRLPLPRQGIEFGVEWKPDMYAPWVQIGTTNKPPYPMTRLGFYRVETLRL